MNRKNKRNKPIIDETILATVVPGMLMSAKTLLEFDDWEWKKGDPSLLSPGNIVATTMITAQCAELLLKYKVEREGQSFKKNTHDLYNLYKKLKEESKAEIQKKFDEETSTIKLPTGWDSADSIFLKARKALVYWRYVVNSPNASATIHPKIFYVATVSVYKTTPIEGLVLAKDVSDPAIKAAILGEPQNSNI